MLHHTLKLMEFIDYYKTLDITKNASDAEIKKAFDAQKAEQGEAFVPVEKREIVALIAYLQRLGTDIKTTEIKTASAK